MARRLAASEGAGLNSPGVGSDVEGQFVRGNVLRRGQAEAQEGAERAQDAYRPDADASKMPCAVPKIACRL